MEPHIPSLHLVFVCVHGCAHAAVNFPLQIIAVLPAPTVPRMDKFRATSSELNWHVCLDSRPKNLQGMLYEQPQHEVTERYVSECSKAAPCGCCLGSGRCASCGRRSARASAWPGPATAVPGNAHPWRASGRGASAVRPRPSAPSRPCPGTLPRSHASPAQHRANEVKLNAAALRF